jgi:hypothetical protein
MGGLYEADIVKWSQQQAELLRRIAAGEPVNEAPDWPNIVDEVEFLGLSETRACASLLVQALLHDLKLAAWPDSTPDSTGAPGWAEEARRFRWEAREAFAPSMRQRLDAARLYAAALRELRRMPQTIDGKTALPVPETCPVTLDELLAG